MHLRSIKKIMYRFLVKIRKFDCNRIFSSEFNLENLTLNKD